MTVRTVAREDLPRASASDPAALRAMQTWSRAAPLETTLQLPGLGAVQIAFERVVEGRVALSPEDAVFALEEGGRWGRLAVDGAFALRLVSATLGRAPELTWRALGRSERGVLAAMIASALTEMGSAARLSLGSSSVASSDAVTVFVKVDALGAAGRVRLDVPLSWLRARADGDTFDAGALPISGALELASTNLSASEWATVRPGDAVVFDGYPAARGQDVWTTGLRIGSFFAETQLEADGTIRLIGGFHPRPRRYPGSIYLEQESPMKDVLSVPPSPPSPPSGAAGVDATSVLAAAPIEIVVEIGRVVLRGDEVSGLARGHVLTLSGARTTAVDLRVGDSVWARGELVDVDGELGVRVLEILRR